MHTRPLARILVLIGLLAALAVAPGLAATAPAAPLAAPAAAQAVPVADFLATLAAVPASSPAAPPPSDCRVSSNSCPAPQLCCLACGYFGCDTYACFNPVNGRCPAFP